MAERSTICVGKDVLKEEETEAVLENLSKSYWNQINWDYERDFPELAREQNNFLTTKVFPRLKSTMDICELACSEGTYARKIAPYVNSIDAYDISAPMIELAKQKTKEAGINNITYHIQDLSLDQMQQNTTKKYYDAVVILGLFTCIVNDAKAKTMANNALESIPSGGYIILKDSMTTEDSFLYSIPNYAAKYRNYNDYMNIFEDYPVTLLDKHTLTRTNNVYSLWCVLQKG